MYEKRGIYMNIYTYDITGSIDLERCLIRSRGLLGYNGHIWK